MFSLNFSISTAKGTESINKKYEEINTDLFHDYIKSQEILNVFYYSGKKDSDLETIKQLLTNIIDSDQNYAPAYLEMARFTLMNESKSKKDLIRELKNLKIIKENTFQRKDSKYYKNLENDIFILRQKVNKYSTDAEIFIEKAIVLEPEWSEPHSLKGHYLTIHDDLENAKKSLNKAIELGGKNPWTYLNYSSINRKEGNFELMKDNCLIAYNSKTENKSAKIESMKCLEGYHGKKAMENAALSDQYTNEIIAYKQEFINERNKEILEHFNNYELDQMFDKLHMEYDSRYKTKDQVVFSNLLTVSVGYLKWAKYVKENGNTEISEELYYDAYNLLIDSNKGLSNLNIDFQMDEIFIKETIEQFTNHKHLSDIFIEKGIESKKDVFKEEWN